MSKDQPMLGIIGGGQLGSMLCQAASRLKIKTFVLSDDRNAPAKKFCNEFIYSKYENLSEIDIFFKQVLSSFQMPCLSNAPLGCINFRDTRKIAD